MKKFISLLLASLMIFSQNYLANALETIKIKGKDYVLPMYSTLFNPLSIEGGITDDYLMTTSSFHYFAAKINNKKIVMPAVFNKYEYISPEDPDYKNASEQLKENYKFLRDNFRNHKDFKKIPTTDFYTTIKEIKSLELIGIELREFWFISDDFFPEEYNVDNPVTVDYGSFKRVWKLKNPNYDEVAALYENRGITFKEFKEYFTGVVFESDWPVTPALSKNENITLPTFNQEELLKDVEGLSFTSIYYTNGKSKEEEVITFITKTIQSENKYEIFDYYTGLLILEYNSDTYNMEYLKKFGIQGDIEYVLGPCLLLSKSVDDYYRRIRYQGLSISCGPEMVPYFGEVETIADAIEVYQLLPIERQADYSQFDFSDDPRIEKSKIKELVKDN